MRAASAFLAFVGLALATSLPDGTFYYEMSSSIWRMDDGCRVCYGEDDCLLLPSARCEYFMEVDEVLDKAEQGGEGSPIDSLLGELTEQATMSWLAQECIPLISQYTTCNKDNLCIGCKSCDCNAAGRWVCSQVQRCRNEPKLIMDHRTLVMVIEKLLEHEKKLRRKRFVENVTDKSESKPISMMDIAEWVFGVTPTTDTDSKTAANNAATELTDYSIETTTQSTTLTPPADSELGFEEVLRNIANDQIYKRRKSQLYENSELDYMDLEDTKTTETNTSQNFIEILNQIEEGNNVAETTTDSKFVVDLYPRGIKNNDVDYNVTGTKVSYLNQEENNTLDISSETLKLDPIHIMKRDVSFVTKVNSVTQDTTALSTTMATKIDLKKGNDLKKNVLIPLTNIISDKESEVKELQRIKENLINIMELFHNKTETNISKEFQSTNDGNTNYSIYKLDLYPELHEDLRRINPSVMNKLLYKLKRDIYEVFKDISSIQKISKIEGLPDDLRLLIRSMKYYVRKQGSIRDFKRNEIQLEKINETRKISLQTNPTAPKSIIRQFIDILENIDKDAPESYDFASSSKSSKKIIKRVIKQNYVPEFSILHFKTHNSEYNLTNDLRTIGKSWPQLTAKLANSPPQEKLYAMKLLHFNLAEDINKITDAMALIDFAHSRRMTPIETPMAEDLMIKINSGLLSIRHKVQKLIKENIKKDRKLLLRDRTNLNQKKKESFLKRIRNMLRSSKAEIIDMVRNKVPKTEIFRTIAQKKLDELSHKQVSDYEPPMLQWHTVLNVTQRKKRDVATKIKTLKRRMKNIIPKYLRGKINPAISKQKSKNQSETKKKKTNKHKNKVTSTVKPMKNAASPLNPVTNTAKTITEVTTPTMALNTIN